MKNFKRSCIAMAICGISISVNSAMAADQSQDATNAQEQAIEKIVVTGSRIKGVDLEGTQPLVILTAEDIRSSGASSVSELMQQLSQTRGGEGSFSTRKWRYVNVDPSRTSCCVITRLRTIVDTYLD